MCIYASKLHILLLLLPENCKRLSQKKISYTQAGDDLFGLIVYLFIWLFDFWENIIQIMVVAWEVLVESHQHILG